MRKKVKQNAAKLVRVSEQAHSWLKRTSSQTGTTISSIIDVALTEFINVQMFRIEMQKKRISEELIRNETMVVSEFIPSRNPVDDSKYITCEMEQTE